MDFSPVMVTFIDGFTAISVDFEIAELISIALDAAAVFAVAFTAPSVTCPGAAASLGFDLCGDGWGSVAVAAFESHKLVIKVVTARALRMVWEVHLG